MQPAAHDIHIPLWQVGKTGQRVFDDGLSYPVRDSLGGQHVEVPGHRVTGFAVEVGQGIIEFQAAGAGIGVEIRCCASQCGDGLGAKDRLMVAVKVLAGGDDPVVEIGAGVAGAAF